MEKFITAAGAALRVNDTGKGGQAVVLLHGYLESLEIWDDLTEILSRKYRVLAIDIPGHGISQTVGEIHTMDFIADVIKGVLDKLAVDKCFMVGHSMGGYAAEAFAARYPERLLGLVLLHSTPNADTQAKKEDRQREIELIKEGKKELIASMFAPKGFAEENRERLGDRIEEFEEMITLNDDEGIIAILRGLIARPDRNEMLRKLSLPQLFIFGRHDDLIPIEAAEKIIADHPQAQVAWLENSGHMGLLEEPDRTAEIISEFIDKHSV